MNERPRDDDGRSVDVAALLERVGRAARSGHVRANVQALTSHERVMLYLGVTIGHAHRDPAELCHAVPAFDYVEYLLALAQRLDENGVP